MNSTLFHNGSSVEQLHGSKERVKHNSNNDEREKPRSRHSKQNKRFMHPLGRSIQVIDKVMKGMVNHSYQDLSLVPPETEFKFPESITEMTFSQKLHHILSQEIYQMYAFWLPHGRAFKIEVPLSFESEVLPVYFGHKRYSTFLRELQSHGYKHITKGVDRNSYYHECMLRGLPHLSKYMPLPRDARRLTEDAANEPNFYRISEAFPLSNMQRQNQISHETSFSGTMLPSKIIPLCSPTNCFNPITSKFSGSMVITDAKTAAVNSKACVSFPEESNSTSGQNQQHHFCEPSE